MNESRHRSRHLNSSKADTPGTRSNPDPLPLINRQPSRILKTPHKWNQGIIMATPNRTPQKSLWQRLMAKLKPSSQNTNNGAQEPESVTLPVMDTFDPDTGRVTEIRYTRKDDD